jgi:transcription antitermination factor NusG
MHVEGAISGRDRLLPYRGVWGESAPNFRLRIGAAMTGWAVAQTEPQRERRARLWLMRSGFETWLPRIKLASGRVAPLFPTYLFVHCSLSRWYPVRWTPGVLRVLMAGDVPAFLPQADVERLRKAEHQGLVRLPKQKRQRGQVVCITKGILVGRAAIFDSMTSEQRARVLLEALGRQTAVEVPASDLQDVAP